MKQGLNWMLEKAHKDGDKAQKVFEQLITIATLNKKNAIKSIEHDTPLPVIKPTGLEMANTTDEKLDSLSVDAIRLGKYYQDAKMFCDSVNWDWQTILSHDFGKPK